MAKILFFTAPAHGHINPTLPVIAELSDRGHSVIYYTGDIFRNAIENTGCEWRDYPASIAMPDEKQVNQLSANMVDISLFMLDIAPEAVAFALEEIEREQPDLILYDTLAIWGRIASTISGVPCVTSIPHFILEDAKGIMTLRDIASMMKSVIPRLPKLLKVRGKLNRTVGKENVPTGSLFPAKGDKTIAYVDASLQPQTPWIDETVTLVGPSINESTRQSNFAFDYASAKRLIYISLGTVYHERLDFYQETFKAFASYDATFILSVGKQTDIQALGQIPVNFHVFNYVPQLEVLQHADIFITHGGMNSINEGLYYGVPLIVIPQQLEQYANSGVVEQSGAGVRRGYRPPYGRVSAKELREVVDEVIKNPTYSQKAQEIREHLHHAGGYRQAVDVIESLFTTVPEPVFA